MARIKSSIKPITFLQDGNVRITDTRDMEAHVVNYFKNIFCGNNNCVPNGLVEGVVPLLVSEEDNVALTSMLLIDEIKNAVFDLNADGAPRPDGFGAHFYQFFWDIVAADVVSSVQEFFYTDVLAPNMNANIIVLIPKIPGASSMGDFCHIALVNLQFKIVTKIIAERVAIICMRIISPH